MNGEYTLRDKLFDSPDLVALLSEFNGKPCISVGIVEPSKWTIKDSTISIYTASPVDNRGGSLVAEITAACRAPTEYKVNEIAKELVKSVNREAIAGGGRYYCQTEAVIAPQDKCDSFNKPVTVTIKSVKGIE